MFKILAKMLFALIVACGVAGISGAIAKVAVPIKIPKERAYIIEVETEDTPPVAQSFNGEVENISKNEIEKEVKDKIAEATATVEVVAEEKAVSFKELLATADVKKGKKISKSCAACHSFDKGGKNKMGPNLWNIVNRDIATVEGFKYSKAMQNAGGKWSYDKLNKFLTKPREDIKGTKMSFAGVKKLEDRAALIAWLRSLSDSPAQLPVE